ncbi:YecA family protein [Thiopseudomonas acetoxidans]|uniref:SEC-C domain-containing protein n=1 Tax=Thiopseudomonas acetoxidans TaxID=3041622 RepID=A0ABT7SQF2_9GAMM|nr:methionyl aminopeptidase [Thiopseudomonas sp. CY1220]MDM7858415.1 SEC-C domain-containing protein [Thiopseudomonas sp. CY1220]
MKTSRNDPCPCGSGKKYKRCCIDHATNQQQGVFDDIAQVIAMNPDLSLDDLNVIAEQRVQQRNNQPIADFCGLSSSQMSNWMYAPFTELDLVTITTPADLSASPVMRYLEIILDEAMANEGSFKATSKGNLPAKLVKQASELLPEFAIAEYQTYPSISEYMGSNEDKFNALHYTRILAEVAGIIYRKSGRYHVKKTAQKQYQNQGLRSFFLPMLEAAVAKYNWSYLDAFDDDIDLRLFWMFLLWRIQSHGSVDQLMDEVYVAFPSLLQQLPQNEYSTPHRQLDSRIESRFVRRFLEYWGFVTLNPKRYSGETRLSRQASIQPLLMQTFTFRV